MAFTSPPAGRGLFGGRAPRSHQLTQALPREPADEEGHELGHPGAGQALDGLVGHAVDRGFGKHASYSALIVRTSDSICLRTLASKAAIILEPPRTSLPAVPKVRAGTPWRGNHTASPGRASAAFRTGSADGLARLVASAEPARTSKKPIPIPTLNDSCNTRTPRVAATAGFT